MTTTVISLLHSGTPDAAGELERTLKPVLELTRFVAAIAGIDDPVSQLAQKINERLDCPLGDLVSTVWTGHGDVCAAIERTRSKPGVEPVPLAKAQVTITDQLRVEIDHVRKSVLEPTLTLTLDVRSLTVTVENGTITEIGTLEADATAQLTISDHKLLATKKPVHVTVPAPLINLRAPDAPTVARR